MFDRRGFYILIFMYCISCANIQSISGGPEDKDSPILVERYSSNNFQTHFKEHEITLSFNEWIRLDNPLGNISISPPTEFQTEYKLKGKRLIIAFDKREQLKENTTYTIQFGESIKDITAGNVQRNISYVFSTGDYVDSLIIRGIVIDAFTKKPKDKTLVCLYKLLDDTAFQKIKPFYFNWTDTAGRFIMKNLSPGTYNLYALEDKNQNYFYDQSNESFAFSTQPITISDTIIQEFKLNVSVQAIPVIIKERKFQAGEARIYFNTNPNAIELKHEATDSILYVNLKDSILIYNLGNNEANCILHYENKMDTLKIQAVIPPLKDSIKIIRIDKSILKPGTPVAFVMNHPILNIIKDSLQSLDSSTIITGFSMDSQDSRKFYIEGNFSPIKPNRIVIQQNAIKGLYNTTNQRDTFTFKYLDKSALSRLNLNLEGLTLNSSYIFQLLNGELISEELKFITTESSKKMFFNNLFPGIYRVRIILDGNKNGIWDPADYTNKKQPEPIWYFDLPDLRADWDVDVSLNL